MIQVYGLSPNQHVFGKNPHVPMDLLQDNVDVVSATSSLFDEALARRQEIRTKARRAVIELQDDKTLKRALAARPRRESFLSRTTCSILEKV